jgi:hypothetical protein
MARPAHLTADLLDLLDRVVVCPSGCWLWTGGNSGNDRSKPGSNYPRCNKPGTRTAMAAHRRVYELFKGPIPDGFTIDHLCAAWVPDPWLSRLCVRIEHLEAISGAENTRRMIMRRRLTHPIEFVAPLAPSIIVPDQAPLLAPGETEEDLQWL